jgi:hypothetical protein
MIPLGEVAKGISMKTLIVAEWYIFLKVYPENQNMVVACAWELANH